ncbi:MAG: hypothetical protein AB7P16_23435 [Bradyrhizobium sp.]|uniref:hypothetical protein n=1 Tax=Bradyrhizobium sp. TaxID=376 RepID=UPI003D13E120
MYYDPTFIAPVHYRGPQGASGMDELLRGLNFKTLLALQADEELRYVPTLRLPVEAGDVVMGGGHRFIVASAAAIDHHIITAGGVKLYLQPSSMGWYNFMGMAPFANGVGNDWPQLKKLMALRFPNGKTSTVGQGPTIFMPSSEYFLNTDVHGLQLKAQTHIIGEASGLGNAFAGTELKLPQDCSGVVFNYFNTLNGGVEPVPTGRADGSSLRNLAITGVRGSNPNAHGIWMRTRGTIYNVMVRNFTGDGVHIVAGVGAGGELEGNANIWVLDTVRVQSCGRHGFYVDGPDANAGVAKACDASSNARWGIYDSSFLGNKWDGCHVATCGNATIAGNPAGRSAMVYNNGSWWSPHPSATEAQLVATEPGTNPLIWCNERPNAYVHAWFPQWLPDQPEGTYFHGGGYKSDNLNSTNGFDTCYAEADMAGNALEGAAAADGGSIFTNGFAFGGYIRSTNGNCRDARGAGAGFLVSHPNAFIAIGQNDVNGDIFRWESYLDALADRTFRLHRRGADWDWDVSNLASRLIMRFTGPGTLEQFGTGVAQAFMALFPRLALGSSTNARIITYSSAAPTTGAHAKGEFVYNSGAIVASDLILGWRCKAAGTPGTWVPVFAEPATSTALAPLALGQIAIVAGVGHIAVGTSGPSDWKQIT